MNRYLEVDFGDNDFGLCFQEALERLFRDVKENNAHLINWPSRSGPLISIFEWLHKEGKLEPMVRRLAVLLHECRDVEFKTRGLHNRVEREQDRSWHHLHSIDEAVDAIRGYDTYFEPLDIRFHTKADFKARGNNGESVWLDMKMGKVGFC